MINVCKFSNLKPKKQKINIKQQIMDKIYQEYSLKRSNFNPTDKSPNKFVKKLQIRMKMYYEELR
tara:strand:- start:2006 stop:2200 length:195 start_codon:yes stop_codon:yes gene_type:complete